MTRKGVAYFVFVLLLIILLNVYRQGGPYAVKSWLGAKFLNRPLPRPEVGRGAAA